MMNQEFKAIGIKYQVLANLVFVAGSQGAAKLRFLAHACAVSALSVKV